jgi:hypothetical protein
MDDRGSSTVVLTDVMDASPHAPEAQFHVIFEASPRTRLEEGIHRLENGGSGPLDLFLSQSELSGNRQRLTATINLQTAA